jgi:hypothetical protein
MGETLDSLDCPEMEGRNLEYLLIGLVNMLFLQGCLRDVDFDFIPLFRLFRAISDFSHPKINQPA